MIPIVSRQAAPSSLSSLSELEVCPQNSVPSLKHVSCQCIALRNSALTLVYVQTRITVRSQQNVYSYRTSNPPPPQCITSSNSVLARLYSNSNYVQYAPKPVSTRLETCLPVCSAKRLRPLSLAAVYSQTRKISPKLASMARNWFGSQGRHAAQTRAAGAARSCQEAPVPSQEASRRWSFGAASAFLPPPSKSEVLRPPSPLSNLEAFLWSPSVPLLLSLLLSALAAAGGGAGGKLSPRRRTSTRPFKRIGNLCPVSRSTAAGVHGFFSWVVYDIG